MVDEGTRYSTQGAAPSSWSRRLYWLFRRLILLAMVGSGIGAVVSWWAYQEYVVQHPGAHIERQHVLGIIRSESPVYYRDGVTPLGVFFDDEHRQFVPWPELPGDYVTAIVAAEDGTFWSHKGVSPKHILRALWLDIRAGAVVAGGSTLTQQTAKNLYYRPDRSIKAKGVELVNALKLEAHHSKEDILTFYANQFHVSGNGRGVGIAARYFFDKDTAELTLLENAFIAGLVKAPAIYDPFTGDEERRARAVQRAHDRTGYVLRRIIDEPTDNLAGARPDPTDPVQLARWESRLAEVQVAKTTAQTLLAEGFELDFHRGVFRFESSAVLDEVARRLDDPVFIDILRRAGIDDPGDAGIEVITTLDAGVQRETLYGLWHHLSEAGTQLEGLGTEAFVRSEGTGPRFDPYRELHRHEFRLGRVSEHGADADGKRVLNLDLGGRDCVVDRAGVVRGAVAVQRGASKDPTAKVPTSGVEAFIDAIPTGSVVWVSVREVPEEATAICDLEVRPELQGAAMVIQDGQIRAMVGGNDNRNFNRATALRQMGSTWKPVVYHAAMELGWSPHDPLFNQRTVFPFSTTFYYPRPDHTPDPVVSLAWAGVRSENIASIWLLYHLTDRLDHAKVSELAASLGLARHEDESEDDYRLRIQQAGVLPTPRRVMESLFLQARQEALVTISQARHPEDELAIAAMLYGWGFSSERTKVGRGDASSRTWKARALDNSWVTLAGRMESCKGQYLALEASLLDDQLPNPEWVDELSVRMEEDTIEVACGIRPEGYGQVNAKLLRFAEAEAEEAQDPEPKRGMFGWMRRAEKEEDTSRLVDLLDVWVVDRVHMSTLLSLEAGIERRLLLRDVAGDEAAGLYDPEILYWHQDFRVLLGMRYVADLARRMGVRSEVREVLSMPLGASEITLEESVMLYSGITTGASWQLSGVAAGGTSVEAPQPPSLLIAEIRHPDGRVLYRATPEEVMVSSTDSGHMTSDILRNVVQWGTGRRASGAVRASGAALPLAGKTGTTNDFRNAAFLGFAPVLEDGVYARDGGYVVGVYVGYDDNRPMSSGRVKLAGSSGALPAWIRTIQGIAELGYLGQPLPALPDMTVWPLAAPEGLVRMQVDPAHGGLPVEGNSGDVGRILTRPVDIDSVTPDLVFERSTRPVRISPRTTDIDIKRLLEEAPELWRRD
jgi:membrane peptidoglycan carboxypeptidase